MIEAHGERYTVVPNAKGVHLHTRIDDFFLIKLFDEQLDVTCRIDDKHKCFACIERKWNVN